jgi:diguanylate cyclase (GGDEF)-like protein
MSSDLRAPAAHLSPRAERRRPSDPEEAVRRLRAEGALRQVACDPVSGLPDRASFVHRLRHALQRDPSRPVAVVVLDLDGFRAVNRRLGLEAGDALLREAGARLRMAARASDPVTRLGSDEFAVLLEDVKPADVLRVAGRLVHALAEEPAAIAASAGVAARVQPTDRAEDVLHAGFRALDRARMLGRGPQSASAETDDRASALGELEVILRRAVDRAEFTSHYQPSVAVKAGCVAGFEVLLWRRSAADRKVG